MYRRTFALGSIAACTMPVFQTSTNGHDHATSAAPSPAVSQEFRFDEAVDFELKSTPVKWQGGQIHLLSLNRFTFSWDAKTCWLTANAKGKLFTFDNVDYTVGVAVFAADGSMLGSATVECHVPRIWLGVYGQQPVDLALDFGISNNYSHAAKFQACISDRTVLTPDQWQSDGGGHTPLRVH